MVDDHSFNFEVRFILACLTNSIFGVSDIKRLSKAFIKAKISVLSFLGILVFS